MITFIVIKALYYQIEIINFDFIKSFDLNIGLVFREWNYIYIFIRLIYNVINKQIYIDIDYKVILIDKL